MQLKHKNKSNDKLTLLLSCRHGYSVNDFKKTSFCRVELVCLLYTYAAGQQILYKSLVNVLLELFDRFRGTKKSTLLQKSIKFFMQKSTPLTGVFSYCSDSEGGAWPESGWPVNQVMVGWLF